MNLCHSVFWSDGTARNGELTVTDVTMNGHRLAGSAERVFERGALTGLLTAECLRPGSAFPPVKLQIGERQRRVVFDGTQRT